MMLFAVRLTLVAIVAAIGALAGLGLLLGSAPRLGDGITRLVLGVSVLLWLALSIVIRWQIARGRNGLTTAVGLGLLSPLIGGLLIGPPLSLFLLLSKWYVSFPTGAIMGAVVWACLSIGARTAARGDATSVMAEHPVAADPPAVGR
jgi:hypothetical protein